MPCPTPSGCYDKFVFWKSTYIFIYIEFVFLCVRVNIEIDRFNDFDNLNIRMFDFICFCKSMPIYHINSRQAPKGYAAAMRKAKILWIESLALVKDMLLRISKPLIQLTNLKSWGDC